MIKMQDGQNKWHNLPVTIIQLERAMPFCRLTSISVSISQRSRKQYLMDVYACVGVFVLWLTCTGFYSHTVAAAITSMRCDNALIPITNSRSIARLATTLFWVKTEIERAHIVATVGQSWIRKSMCKLRWMFTKSSLCIKILLFTFVFSYCILRPQ